MGPFEADAGFIIAIRLVIFFFFQELIFKKQKEIYKAETHNLQIGQYLCCSC